MSDPTTSEAFSKQAFRGRVYGITGAAHGIGEATADRLLGLGARVVVIDRDAAELSRVREAWRPHGDNVLLVRGDVAEDRVLKRAVNAAARRWERIDGWVSNAAFNPFGSVEKESPDQFDLAWRVNVRAAWLAAKVVLPHLPRSGGSLVTVGSILAHQNYPQSCAYAATKAALEGLTRAMAVELAPRRVRVNTVVPGMIETFYHYSRRRIRASRKWTGGIPREDVERWYALRKNFRGHQSRSFQPWPLPGRPNDVAGAILFLLSDAAAFISGESLMVDGAMSVYQPRVMAMDLPTIAADQTELRELGERHAALRLPGILTYRTPGPKRSPKSRTSGKPARRRRR
jgi:NAD(P)-dependent dehydrogenase (short-subunit alcohol dehydrogenase family)